MARDLAEELERNIPLSEMIQTLRRELQVSMSVSRDEDLRFEVPEVELELRVAVERMGGADGQIRFWVLGAGATRGHGTEQVHTFRLKLRPVARDRGAVEVADMVEQRPR